MRCVIQRVLSSSVSVGGKVVGSIGPGLLILAAVEKGDDAAGMEAAAMKLVNLRIFSDAAGKMNLSVIEAGGSLLAVSQFTLAGSIDRGRRPGFDRAEEPERARMLFDLFVEALRSKGVTVETGVFREYMEVALVNDGPVTFVYDTSRGNGSSGF